MAGLTLAVFATGGLGYSWSMAMPRLLSLTDNWVSSDGSLTRVYP